MKPTNPIIPWLGGKRRLASKIMPLFALHQCYVEPFAGGAALFFYKNPAKAEVLNDLNGELINLYRMVKNHPEEFIRQFDLAFASREMFNSLLETPLKTLTEIQRATRFYYLQKLSFGGKLTHQTFGTATTTTPKLNPRTLHRDLDAAHQRLARTCIEHLPWADVVRRYDRPHTLFYCDPPYWGTEGYGVDFGLDEYTKMADLAKSIKGKMAISVNDIPEMRKIFKGLDMTELQTKYTLSGGGGQKVAQELLIRNYT